MVAPAWAGIKSRPERRDRRRRRGPPSAGTRKVDRPAGHGPARGHLLGRRRLIAPAGPFLSFSRGVPVTTSEVDQSTRNRPNRWHPVTWCLVRPDSTPDRLGHRRLHAPRDCMPTVVATPGRPPRGEAPPSARGRAPPSARGRGPALRPVRPRPRPAAPRRGQAAATSSIAAPSPATMVSISSSVITNAGEMWIAWPRRTRVAIP
jgi:hypothetical protein